MSGQIMFPFWCPVFSLCKLLILNLSAYKGLEGGFFWFNARQKAFLYAIDDTKLSP